MICLNLQYFVFQCSSWHNLSFDTDLSSVWPVCLFQLPGDYTYVKNWGSTNRCFIETSSINFKLMRASEKKRKDMDYVIVYIEIQARFFGCGQADLSTASFIHFNADFYEDNNIFKTLFAFHTSVSDCRVQMYWLCWTLSKSYIFWDGKHPLCVDESPKQRKKDMFSNVSMTWPCLSVGKSGVKVTEPSQIFFAFKNQCLVCRHVLQCMCVCVCVRPSNRTLIDVHLI